MIEKFYGYASSEPAVRQIQRKIDPVSALSC
jgi:hypothetical protein